MSVTMGIPRRAVQVALEPRERLACARGGLELDELRVKREDVA